MKRVYPQAIAYRTIAHKSIGTGLVMFMVLALLASCGTQTTTTPTAPATTGNEIPTAVEPTTAIAPTTATGSTDAMTDTGVLEPGQTANEVSFSEITDNLQQWTGKTVTVRGNLGDMLGDRAFSLDEPGLGADTFVVIAANDQVIPMDEPIFGQQGAGANEYVQVTGEVRPFDLASVEQDLSVDLQDDLFGSYASQPAIIAQTINVVGDDNGAGTNGNTTGNAASVLSVANVVGNADNYIGQQVTVRGSVDTIKQATVFTLDENAALAAGIDNDLLVVAGQANAFALDDGWLNDEVLVTGTIQRFVRADVERDYGITFDDGTIDQYESRPVLIATGVQKVQP